MARSVAKRTTSSAPDTKFRSANDIKLPGELDLHRFDLAQACVHTEDPRNWPEEEPPCVVLRAYGPEEIAKILIKQFHVGIRKCSIAYLWTENMGQGAKVTLGKAAKAPARWQFIAQVDFVLVFKRQALAAEYQRRSLRQMAAVRGVSWQAVQQQLVRVGVRLRTKGGDQRRFRYAALARDRIYDSSPLLANVELA